LFVAPYPVFAFKSKYYRIFLLNPPDPETPKEAALFSTTTTFVVPEFTWPFIEKDAEPLPPMPCILPVVEVFVTTVQ
jgi:hypothetical protein